MTDREKKVIENRVLLMAKAIEQMGYGDADVRILIVNGEISLDIVRWEKYKSGEKLTDVKRKYLLDSFYGKTGWKHDLSEDMNSYFQKKGILLEDEKEGEKESA